MPITPIPRSLYPLVPQLPGVPPLLRSGAQILDTITLGMFGIGDALDSIIGTEPLKWGVFTKDGDPITEYDSFSSFELDDSSRISTYPVEGGSFANYNKVDNPYAIRVVLSCGGNEQRRAQFIADLEAARRSLTLYSVFIPERTYQSANLTQLTFRRSVQDGAYVVYATLIMEEVRERVAADFAGTAQPSGAPTNELGQLQPIPDVNVDLSDVA